MARMNSIEGKNELINIGLTGEEKAKQFFLNLFEDLSNINIVERENGFNPFDFLLLNQTTKKFLRVEIENTTDITWTNSVFEMFEKRKWHGIHIPDRKVWELDSNNIVIEPRRFKKKDDAFDLYMRFSIDLSSFWAITWDKIVELDTEKYKIPVDIYEYPKIGKHPNPNKFDDISNTNDVLCINEIVVEEENGKRIFVDDKIMLKNYILSLL